MGQKLDALKNVSLVVSPLLLIALGVLIYLYIKAANNKNSSSSSSDSNCDKPNADLSACSDALKKAQKDLTDSLSRENSLAKTLSICNSMSADLQTKANAINGIQLISGVTADATCGQSGCGIASLKYKGKCILGSKGID